MAQFKLLQNIVWQDETLPCGTIIDSDATTANVESWVLYGWAVPHDPSGEPSHDESLDPVVPSVPDVSPISPVGSDVDPAVVAPEPVDDVPADHVDEPPPPAPEPIPEPEPAPEPPPAPKRKRK